MRQPVERYGELSGTRQQVERHGQEMALSGPGGPDHSTDQAQPTMALGPQWHGDARVAARPAGRYPRQSRISEADRALVATSRVGCMSPRSRGTKSSARRKTQPPGGHEASGEMFRRRTRRNNAARAPIERRWMRFRRSRRPSLRLDRELPSGGVSRRLSSRRSGRRSASGSWRSGGRERAAAASRCPCDQERHQERGALGLQRAYGAPRCWSHHFFALFFFASWRV